ncbi:hypothetical protein KC332_g14699 [Hortaea werneckii]|uniref:Uncharacterized protein n=2 Tax=Hortaea werneckii TaxID=91943 RepID=A0A3M7HTY3_HORWE|nr:hypothetical protein KC358_g11701 [Hortaea werneckii]OTA28370.1 hypothetical protein BTJ68_08579 [Hortaea werneckii EXF-2000]KAI6817786.1 hypothetical protein KC350_g10512 [Hortaea werneckii]KAI6915592.1 hypothetical protein KC348_g11950 [Hortaea werneckii]KAI6928621.1 hypothetical protein KC341_g11398 [Hortaea werneckii]
MPSKGMSSELPPSYEAQREEEEHLPVYRRSEQADPNTLPADHVSPSEVRQFISHFLASQRQFPVDHAQRIAACWTVGSGLELRTYSALMYLEISGIEDGWILYREFALIIRAELAKKAINRHKLEIFCAVSLFAFIALIVFVVLNNDRVWTSVAVFGIIVCGLVTLAAFSMRCGGPNLEQDITLELKHAAEKVESRNK